MVSKKTRRPRASVVNELTLAQLQKIVNFMKTSTYTRKGVQMHYLVPVGEYHKCTLVCTKDKKGNYKYPQIDLNRFGIPGKQLVHLIYWRWINEGEKINDELTISHCDADHTVLHLVQESVQFNESRKHCHLLKWWKAHPGEGRARCPHWENPCSGPQ